MKKTIPRQVSLRSTPKVSESEIVFKIDRTQTLLLLIFGIIFGSFFIGLVFQKEWAYIKTNYSKMNFFELINNMITENNNNWMFFMMFLVIGLFIYALINYIFSKKSKYEVLKMDRKAINFKKRDNILLDFDYYEWQSIKKIALIEYYYADLTDKIYSERKKIIIILKNGAIKQTTYIGGSQSVVFNFLNRIVPENTKILCHEKIDAFNDI